MKLYLSLFQRSRAAAPVGYVRFCGRLIIVGLRDESCAPAPLGVCSEKHINFVRQFCVPFKDLPCVCAPRIPSNERIPPDHAAPL